VPVRDVLSLALSEDGAFLVVCGQDTTTFYEVATLERRWSLKIGATNAVFSPDGSLIALALLHGSVSLVHAVDGSAREIGVDGVRLQRPLFSGPSAALCFDLESEILYSAGAAGVDALDIVNYSVRANVALDGMSKLIARCPSSGLLVVGGDTTVAVHGSTVASRTEVEHLTALDPTSLAVSHELALAAPPVEADPLGKTGSIRRARFVPGSDVVVALHARMDGSRVVQAWRATSGVTVFWELVDTETRDLAVDPRGGVWLLTPSLARRWRELEI